MLTFTSTKRARDRSILQEALALPAKDGCELAERIGESPIARERAGGPGECLRRGYSRVARCGHDADDTPKWACRRCGRTFTERAGGLQC